MKLKKRSLARAICFAVITAEFSEVTAQPIDLSLLGQQGITIKGSISNGRVGQSVTGAGDVNGDGIADFVVGASGISSGVNGPAGEAYVVFGQTQSGDFETESIASGGFTLGGALSGDFAGFSVSGAGDVNGDGLDDVVIGLPGAAAYIGQAVVVFGRASSRPVNIRDLQDNGFRIVDNFVGGNLGFSVSGAGDVNGDGLDDVIIGHKYANAAGRSNAGAAYVVFGKTDRRPVDVANLGDDGTVIQGAVRFQNIGHTVAGAGDVNGDGLADIVVGDRDSASTYVIFGQEVANTVDLSVLGLKGYRIECPSASQASGAGDVNGDGLADIIIGARLGNGGEGQAYVAFGKRDVDPIDLNLMTDEGFRITPDSTAGSGRLGTSVASAGDINGDGFADLIVGAPEATYLTTAKTGVAYLVLGKADSDDVSLTALANTHHYLLGGAEADNTGRFVSGAGDVNGDGLADVLVGAYGADPGGRDGAGSAYLVFSAEAAPESATYKAYAAPGDAPQLAIGVAGDSSNHSSPDSRVWLDFSDGRGAFSMPSFQTVTINRGDSPLPDPGAGVYWQVLSDRISWTAADITFRYLDSEVVAHSELDLRLFHSELLEGPYTELPAVLNGQRNTINAGVTEFGYFFLGQGERPDPLFSNGFE